MGMFYRTIRMLEHGIKPVYVFDGKPPQLKSAEVSMDSDFLSAFCHCRSSSQLCPLHYFHCSVAFVCMSFVILITFKSNSATQIVT